MPYFLIREPGQGKIVWQGEYATKEAALEAYDSEYGAEIRQYYSQDPTWMDRLEVEERKE